MTGARGSISTTDAIAAVLGKLRLLDAWDTKPPATTAALLLEEDPASLSLAWEKAYALLYSMDSSTAALLDAVSTTGSPCGTALGAAIDPADLVVVDGFTSPLPGSHITSGFGYRINPVSGIRLLHEGVDLAYGSTQTCNRPIVAASEGVVVFAGAAAGYGHVIMINHPNGMQTRYGHMYAQGVLVKAGDHVSTGQVIALVGSDGNSTACHLHFETRVPSGQAVNPVTVMPWLATGH
jgi:murein DD-endopeptidase MepM/ murein hydrolase activator NlpD